MLLDKIKKRRSVYPDQYTGEAVKEDQLRLLLEAANQAPSHRNTEPWRFKIFTKASLGKLSEYISGAYTHSTPEDKFSDFKLKKTLQKIEKSGAVILISMQRDPKESVPEWEEIAATAMAVQNAWLMASDLGLGCYWSTPPLISEMHRYVNFAEGERCLGFLYVGHIQGELPQVTKRPLEEKTEWF